MKLKFIFVLFLLTQVSISQNFKYGKVSKEELMEKEHPLDPSANAAVLYREYKTHFEHTESEGFFLVTTVQERIKIYKKEGFHWANKKINQYQSSGGRKEKITSLKGHTYNLIDNKIEDDKLKKTGIFDEKASKYLVRKKITMPNIKEGSVIEIKYTIQSPFKNNIDEYRFQEKIPVNKVKMSFEAPEYFNYKTHIKGWVPVKIINDRRERKMQYRYTSAPTRSQSTYKAESTEITFDENIFKVLLNDIPSMKEEDYAGNIENYMSSLKLELSFTKFPGSVGENYSTSWEAVSKTIYESEAFGGELKKENYFKDDIDKLIKGISNQNEKISRIFEYVKTKMNWNKYYGCFTDDGVKKSFKQGTGNTAEINLMLTAMLRYAGINANPILISQKDNGIPIFPTINGFDYVISGVEIKDDVILLDVTDKQAEINILKTNLLNWKGRIIRKDRSSTWVSLTPKKHAMFNEMINAKINDDYSISGNAQARYSGHFSKNIRDEYKLLSEEDIKKQLEKEKGETELNNIEFSDLNVLNKPISLKFDFENTDAVEEISGKLYVTPLLFLKRKESPFNLESRNYPVDFEYTRKKRFMINIEIPEGYEVEIIPESSSFSFGKNLGSFRYNVSMTGNKIQLSSEFSINSPWIDSSEYENLKGFYQLVIEKQNEKVVLKKIE